MKVGILGGGMWGRTVAWRVANAGGEAVVWSRTPSKAGKALKKESGGDKRGKRISATGDLVRALEPELVLVAVPPAAIRALMKDCAPHLTPSQSVVHVVKGLEAGGATVTQVIEAETLALRTGALAGPWAADELRAGEDTAAVVGSRLQSVVDLTIEALASPQVRVYGTLDVLGVEVGGAMRTPLAIASGLIQGAGLGRSLMAVLLTRGIAEAARLAVAMGGDRTTVSGLSGIGDWMLTCTDRKDELVQAGIAVAAGKPFDHPEGAARVRTLVGLANSRGVDLPIAGAVGAILDGVPFQDVLGELMRREQRPEAE
ncbi:MAG: NAD(P)-binding domain-containing protein [Proteobacteria bacterium]|nr:NAD(P)-binding domain-containing protein [Pseudomonadota bacterium]